MSEDDNQEILRLAEEMSGGTEGDLIDLLKGRLEVGLKRYGHGVRIEDDTTEYGTENDDWLEMLEEEIGDAIVYALAESIRFKRRGYDGVEHLYMVVTMMAEALGQLRTAQEKRGTSGVMPIDARSVYGRSLHQQRK